MDFRIVGVAYSSGRCDPERAHCQSGRQQNKSGEHQPADDQFQTLDWIFTQHHHLDVRRPSERETTNDPNGIFAQGDVTDVVDLPEGERAQRLDFVVLHRQCF